MCYNCGCRIPQDDMGDPKNITDQTFKKLAEELGKNERETKELVKKYLQAADTNNKQIEKIFEEASKAWGQSVEDAKKNTLKML